MSIAKRNEVETEEVNEIEEEHQTASSLMKPSASAPAVSNPESVLSADEMNDLDFGFGAFPTVTLDKGEFEVSDGSVELGTEFDCKILQYKSKYFYRSYVSDTDVEFFYSFDQVSTTAGESVADVLAQWKEEGRPAHTVKKYLEVTAILSGENEGTIVLLSVSPSSVARFSGYVAGELNAVRGIHYKNVITTVSVGAKLTKVKFPFRPWAFSFKAEV